MLRERSSSSTSSSPIPPEQALAGFAFFVGGAVIVLEFTVAFSARGCPFPPTSGIVFDGSISATCKASVTFNPKSGLYITHFFVTYFHHIGVIVRFVLHGRSYKVFVLHIRLSIIHNGSFALSNGPGFERLCNASAMRLNGISIFIKLLCGEGSR
jgi:hypothetical protein